MQQLSIRWMCHQGPASMFKKQQWWTGFALIWIIWALSYLPLDLYQRLSLGEWVWPLRKSKAQARGGEQRTNPRQLLQNNALSISAPLLAHPAIPATHFPWSQRDVAWRASGHSIPITSRSVEGTEPQGSVNEELFTKGQYFTSWQFKMVSLLAAMCYLAPLPWSFLGRNFAAHHST